MYLEKLEIQGFKSFANKNKLIFSGIISNNKRGITAVVGPNGSGKSNIADAVRWVLGEQSAKTLRSKKGDDVIFMGSDKKARLNFAEVSLYLNNQESNIYFKNNKQIELENNFKNENKELEGVEKNEKEEIDNIDALLMSPEIIITRRVYRDGGGEYLINNNKVRLSDIQIFLAKASFGQKTYSVIGQGMVENFLNTSPAERKAFFDEATGVKQYQIKRDISLGKLETSQENLNQVEMLLKEIEPRLNSLTRQVNRLKKRQELEESLEKHQLDYYSSLWNDINKKLEEINNKIQETEKKKNLIKNELKTKKEECDKNNQESSVNNQFLKLQEELLILKENINKLEKQNNFILEWEGLRAQGKNNENLDNLVKEKNIKIKELDELNIKTENLPKIDEKIELLSQSELSLSKLNSEKNDKQRELMKLETLLELRLEKTGNFDISFLFSRQAELKDELNKTIEEKNVLNIEIENKENKLLKESKTKEEIEIKLKSLEEELRKIRSEYDPNNIKKINSDLENILTSIKDTENSSDISFFKKIVLEIRSNINDLLSFVSGQKFDNALEKINLEIDKFKNKKNEITDSLNDLKLNINIDKNRKNQLDIQEGKINKDLLDIEGKIKSNEQEESLDEIKDKKNVIEKEMEKINNNILEIKLEIENLKNFININREEKNFLEKNIRELKDEINKQESEINYIKSSDAKNQAKLENLEEEIKNNKVIPKSDNFLDIIKSEKEYINLNLDKKRERLEVLELNLSNFNKEQEEKRQYFLKLQQEVYELEKNISSYYNQLNNDKIEIAREETRMEDLENNILDDKLELDKIKRYKMENSENIDLNNLRNEINKIKNQLELIGGIDPEVEKEYVETKKRYDFLFEQTDDLNKTIKSLEKVIVELDALIKDRFDSEFKLISEKFNEYFKILFNGGSAKIFPIKEESLEENLSNQEATNQEIDKNKETDNSKMFKKIKYLKKYNALGLSGVDILAVPPGKKITSVNMLSGGERALTSIALICAIISANPAPFVMLDEVDAALDEANSERLAKILDDLSNKTQFIAITHNRATMKKANILYGVSMATDGVSQLLSIKLDEYKEKL